MKGASGRIKKIVDDMSVNQYVYENRTVWTVHGKSKEYWVEPDMDFCCCAGYYFAGLHGKCNCYHLESLKIAIKQKKYKTIPLDDQGYDDLIARLVAGI